MMEPREALELARSLDAGGFEELLRRAIAFLEGGGPAGGRASRRGGLVAIERFPGSIVVVGDLHGDAESLGQLLSGPAGQAMVEGGVVVFLGDYVDRGPAQVEVLAAVLALMMERPGSVVALRGNHEPPPWLLPSPHDYPHSLASRFGQRGRELYDLSMELFQRLPHAAFSGNGLFMVHGGPPSEPRRLEDLERPERADLEDLLWSDPSPIRGSAPSPRGAGHLYGPDVSSRFLSDNGLSMIVRSHEPCEGYRVDHGGRVVTVFSRRGPPYMNSRIGYFRASASDPPGEPERHAAVLRGPT